MAKLNREALAHYIDTKFGATGGPSWEIIGADIEEMSVEMNPDIESFKNILGQTKVTDNGYEPSMDADPFYADPSSDLYKKLRDIVLGRLKSDHCKTKMLEVLVEDATATNHLAYTQEVQVSPNSYGGDTAGVNIPFTVTDNGARVKGYVTFDSSTHAPTFTAGEIPSGGVG